jgi:hypothetical protein
MLNDTEIAVIERRQQELRDELSKNEEKLRKQKDIELEKQLEPLKNLVIQCHDVLCGWNHTDGCGWHYGWNCTDGCGWHYEVEKGQHMWQSWAHVRWLNKINDVINPDKNSNLPPVSVEALSALIEKIKELKKIDPNIMRVFRCKVLDI